MQEIVIEIALCGSGLLGVLMGGLYAFALLRD